MIRLRKILFKIPATVLRSSIVASQSFHRHTIGQHYRPILSGILVLLAFSVSRGQEVVIKFHHTANGKRLVLQDSTYSNAFNEPYQLTRLKYYISDIGFTQSPQKNVELIDVATNDSVIIKAKAGNYAKLYFTLGIDSALNCSGAQAGALDPLNGMFWTWNSGYIFFKLEGYSTASTADLNRIEHHVGGYRYPNNVAKNIALNLPQAIQLNATDKKIIHVQLNLDKYWQGIHSIKIAEQPLLMTPGGLALKAADNFAGMFSITSIQ
ncbi:MAG: hypothetical protein EOP53_01660 [Sphingobacteriales bacterium]|nr:MAG: hypothetical protein EOP53_01660 [Sphingobacteriales bacterium]